MDSTRTRGSWRRRAVPALAAAVALAAAAPATAAAPESWTALGEQIAAPWPGLQDADGHFRDYVLARDPSDGRDDYGDPMLGYALLLTAARTGDDDLATSGLRALERSLDRPGRSPSTEVFHELALTSAYNLARERFAGNAVFQRARAHWEDVLREIAPYRLGRSAVTNKSIVEAVGTIELLRSGLSSTTPGAVLADPAGSAALVKGFLAHDLPAAARPYERAGRAVLGDFPLLPPAYHALAIGMLARAVDLLGADAPGKGRSLLARAAAASAATAGPDGDVAYHGRSQEMAWTLGLTAYGVEGLPGYGGLADRVIQRMRDAYASGPEGFLVNPALGQGIDAAIPGLDEYVAAVSYVGLSLASLEWAIERAGDVASAPFDADRPGTRVIGTGAGSWATARSGDAWFAVKRARTSVRDLRYDFGLVAVKRLLGDEAWYDAIPLRPRTAGRDETAGPVLEGSGGAAAATSLARRGGGIVARGGFQTKSGRWVRRGVSFEFVPVACGVRLTFDAKPGDRFRLSAFFTESPEVRSRSLSAAGQSVSFDRAATTTVSAGYSSGADARLTRARIRLAAGDNRPAITYCAH